jgi:hypothetical protein
MTSAHRRRATTHPVMRRQHVERRRWCIARQRRLEVERRQRRDKWGVASCDNLMAKKRLRQSREAEWVAARQQGRRDNQLANKRQREGRRTRGKQEGRHQGTTGGGAPRGQEAAAARREASRQPAGGASRASSSSSASFLPRQDGGPFENPNNGGNSDVSCVIREFGIGKIRASTVVVVDPLASPPSSPQSDVRRALLAAAAPATKKLRLQQ